MLQAECLQQAHALFRGSLYLHVLVMTGTSGNDVIHDTPDHVLALAELHLAHEREYLKHHHNVHSPTSSDDDEDATMEDVSDSSSDTVSPLTTVSTTSCQTQHDSYSKIRSRAFLVDSSTTTAPSCSLPAGIIHIFNMALCHQLKDAHSTKAYIFYEMALVLLSVLPSTNNATTAELVDATLKNLGIWCQDNQQGEAAQTYFGYLLRLQQVRKPPVGQQLYQAFGGVLGALLTQEQNTNVATVP